MCTGAAAFCAAATVATSALLASAIKATSRSKRKPKLVFLISCFPPKEFDVGNGGSRQRVGSQLRLVTGRRYLSGECGGRLARVMVMVAVAMKAKREQDYMVTKFGDGYRQYRHPTSFLVPRICQRGAAGVQANSHRLATLLAIANRTTAIPIRTSTCGQRWETGSSRQNTLVKPSIAQALMVSRPAICIDCGIKKRGNMLPPIDDITRMTSVESAPSWARVLQIAASNRPNAATATAVVRPITKNPGMWVQKSSLNTAQPHRNISTSCAKASRVLKVSLPSIRLVMVTRELRIRSRVPLSASSSSAPAAPLAVKSRNITPIA